LADDQKDQAVVTQSLHPRPFGRRRLRREAVQDMLFNGLSTRRKSIHTPRALRLTRVPPSALYVDIFMVPHMTNRATPRLTCRLN